MKYPDIDKMIGKWGFSGSNRFSNDKKYNPLNLEINNKLKIERLESELKILENEILFFTGTKRGSEDISALTSDLLNYIRMAREELELGHVDTAWKIYHLIKRLQYYTYPENLVKKETKILLSESSKLNEWRKNAISEILDTEDAQNIITSGDIFRAAKLKDEHYENIYYKSKLATYSIKLMFLFLVAIVIIIGLHLYFVDLDRLIVDPRGVNRSVNFFPLSLLVFFFGTLGVCISTLFQVRSASRSSKIPELINNFYFTLTRMMIGGVSAVLFVIFLESEFSNILFHNISLRPNHVLTYFFIAFVAGFTERFLFKTIG